ncbi:MAG: T9SS type A sorting domain-containing protein [Ignavibacteria bacterium]
MKTIITFIACIYTSLGLYSQTTYIWTGSLNNNFSTASNWSPTRQVGLTTDILIFNTGTPLNIINVNQVTLGQLIVVHNTQLRLSPSTGNPKVVSIQGISAGNGPLGEHINIADVKYKEYMLPESEDIATQKYKEYMITDKTEEQNDIATIKYNEYKIPPKIGMGDLKSANSEFDFSYTDDLTIDSTSSLTIIGNDPRLSIYLKQNATASIYGSLILTGEGLNSINSFGTYAITFKTGSSLVQSCPGYIFTNTGVNNSVIFEDGSTFVVNHSGALDPFALQAPSSKVSFYDHSNLKFTVNNQNALKINGRQFPNLIIGSNCNINVVESITSDVQINDLEINTGGFLYIHNISAANVPHFNIKGNLSINGELHFPQNEGTYLTLNFNGTSQQIFSGNGDIDINAGVKVLNIYNDILLNRDLTVRCMVVHHNGTINTNGYHFRVYDQYSSREQIPDGMMIISHESIKDNKSANKENKNQSTENNSSAVPEAFSISQNYPNPFNPNTKIDYTLPKTAFVKIMVYDLSGKEIATLVNTSKAAGRNSLEFDGTNLASGAYIYKMIAESGNGEIFTKTMKMILTK